MSAPFDEISIEFIPVEKMRYSSCGDWKIVPGIDDKKVLLISVSAMDDWRSESAVALHELAEAIMCYANNIDFRKVDSFDIGNESNDPGELKEAPYWTQHGFATAIERIATTQMGLSWLEHEERIANLFDKT